MSIKEGKKIMESLAQQPSAPVEEEEQQHQDELVVTLRRFNLSDLDDYMVWASDDMVSRFLSAKTYTNKSDLLKYIYYVVLPHPWFKAICVGGRPVGSISVRPFGGNERCRGEMGYVLASGHWGKGITTKAVKLALEMVFDELKGLQRVEALVDVENPASQRVLEKAGFKKEGVLRKYMYLKGRIIDMVMYSFVTGDDDVVNC